MGVNEITQLISNFGFPMVACGALAYYVKYTTDKQRNEVTTALNNNTIALTKLCERLDMKEVK